MSLVKTAKDKEPADVWLSPKETWEYVTVPEEDPLGKGYPDISLNKHVFSAGETYNLPKKSQPTLRIGSKYSTAPA